MFVAPGSWRNQNSPQPLDVGTDLASQRLPPAWALTSSGADTLQRNPFGHGMVGVGLALGVLLGVVVREPVRVAVPVDVAVNVDVAVRVTVGVRVGVQVDEAVRVAVALNV